MGLLRKLLSKLRRPARESGTIKVHFDIAKGHGGTFLRNGMRVKAVNIPEDGLMTITKVFPDGNDVEVEYRDGSRGKRPAEFLAPAGTRRRRRRRRE